MLGPACSLFGFVKVACFEEAPRQSDEGFNEGSGKVTLIRRDFIDQSLISGDSGGIVPSLFLQKR
ncbi:MAG: hypothetical protein ACJARY_001103 [Candidatus Azotimanducaceae bacterium]|jgi:hypothetical protein